MSSWDSRESGSFELDYHGLNENTDTVVEMMPINPPAQSPALKSSIAPARPPALRRLRRYYVRFAVEPTYFQIPNAAEEMEKEIKRKQEEDESYERKMRWTAVGVIAFIFSIILFIAVCTT